MENPQERTDEEIRKVLRKLERFDRNGQFTLSLSEDRQSIIWKLKRNGAPIMSVPLEGFFD